MGSIHDVLEALLLALFYGFVAIVAWPLLTRPAIWTGMLSRDGRGAPDPERVQLLGITVFGLGSYVVTALTEMRASGGTLATLPDVPDWLLPVLAGSHAVYLSGKIARSTVPASAAGATPAASTNPPPAPSAPPSSTGTEP